MKCNTCESLNKQYSKLYISHIELKEKHYKLELKLDYTKEQFEIMLKSIRDKTK